jgi:D-alanyl-D-alanine carboxypeptidase
MSLKRMIIAALLLFVIGWALDVDKKLGFGRATGGIQLDAASAVLMDADTGEWIYLYNASEPLPPASMSKMMTEVLVLDRIKAGKLAWQDRVVVSSYAAAVGGATMGLREGQSSTVRELFEALAIHSANDAAIALAEFIAGSETAFVELMNAKVNEIGLSSGTFFANSTGLSSDDLNQFATAAAEDETVMTAKDVAKLAQYLIVIHPEVLKITKKSAVSGQGVTELRTTNEMLPGQRFGTAGNDGLKTGYTKRAGYCFTGTTVINGRRYITVVMGTQSPEARFEETKKLLTYGGGEAS